MATAIRTPFFSPNTFTSSNNNNQLLLLRLHSSKQPTHSSFPNFSISCSSQSHSHSPRHRPPYIPNHIPDPSYVRIFDTTLRDGEQSPGASMTSKEKLDIARQLAKLGVDIIEAGFPAASREDLEAVKMIANEVGNDVDDNGYVPVICGLSRCNENDIRTAWDAVKHAKRPRIHTFIATSAIHMEFKLRMSKQQVIDKARTMVAFARSLGCQDVEFSPEDAGRYLLTHCLIYFISTLTFFCDMI